MSTRIKKRRQEGKLAMQGAGQGDINNYNNDKVGKLTNQQRVEAIWGRGDNTVLQLSVLQLSQSNTLRLHEAPNLRCAIYQILRKSLRASYLLTLPIIVLVDW